MVSFLHNFLPQPILFDLGIIKIYYYSFFFIIAVLLGLFLIGKFAKKAKLDPGQVDNLIFYLFIFGLVGARLYHVIFYNLNYFTIYPWQIFYFWQGGIAIQGAIIGCIITLYFYSQKHHLNFWQYSDVFVLPLILGQAIGRFGNYFNQELYGQPTALPWGIPINPLHRLSGYENFIYYHPIFFYEAILNLFLFIILLFLFYKKNLKEGSLTLIYLIGYSVIRFFMEFLRIELVVTIYGFRFSQIVCLLIIFISTVIFFYKNHR